jgi:hypothetical protein
VENNTIHNSPSPADLSLVLLAVDSKNLHY